MNTNVIDEANSLLTPEFLIRLASQFGADTLAIQKAHARCAANSVELFDSASVGAGWYQLGYGPYRSLRPTAPLVKRLNPRMVFWTN